MNEPGRPPRPKLVAVPGGEGGEGPVPARPHARDVRRAWLPLLLGVALALLAVAFAWEARRATALEARLTEVQASLALAEARLAAWGAWRAEVRGRAERVGRDLRELDAALARDPAETAPRE